MDMARTLLDELLAPRRIVRFEFNTAQLIGQIGKLAVSIPLQKASFSFKGPISLQGNDQDQIRRIEDVVVSGTHYDHCGGQL